MHRRAHPDWCSPARCTVSAGPAGLHRSDPYTVPTAGGTTALVGLWQPQPTDDMPHPRPYTVLLDGADLIAADLTRLADRRRERRKVRAQLRTSLATLTANTRRAAA